MAHAVRDTEDREAEDDHVVDYGELTPLETPVAQCNVIEAEPSSGSEDAVMPNAEVRTKSMRN